MSRNTTTIERLRSLLVLVAVIGTIAFNFAASAGWVNGVTTGEISDKYPTVVTPAGYAFSIWSLIYLGLIGFAILQALPKNLNKFTEIRSTLILNCALNCAWIFFWHSDQVVICFILIALMLGTLIYIVAKLRDLKGSAAEIVFTKGTFGIYLGWVLAATFANLAIMFASLRNDLSNSIPFGAALLLLAAAGGVAVRVKLLNFVAPLAVAWALTAIAVKQSGKTLIVSAAAVGVVACLIAAASIVVNLKGTNYERR